MQRAAFGLIVIVGFSLPILAADPPQLWNGKPVTTAKPAASSSKAVDKEAKPVSQAESKPPREPEWLRRMDKNDRATLTGGWKLQNWSGGTESLTTAGDRSGQYAPNTYQGRQFQQWNNVSHRQDVPSWNAPTPTFPPHMWSQGYVSPNTYFGTDAQHWGNISPGTAVPNPLSGGWSWR